MYRFKPSIVARHRRRAIKNAQQFMRRHAAQTTAPKAEVFEKAAPSEWSE